MPVANDTRSAVLSLQRRMLGKEIGDLGLDGLRQQCARTIAQHLGEWILE
jgi:hypothetical protein